jgi:hypothetical protein
MFRRITLVALFAFSLVGTATAHPSGVANFVPSGALTTAFGFSFDAKIVSEPTGRRNRPRKRWVEGSMWFAFDDDNAVFVDTDPAKHSNRVISDQYDWLFQDRSGYLDDGTAKQLKDGDIPLVRRRAAETVSTDDGDFIDYAFDFAAPIDLDRGWVPDLGGQGDDRPRYEVSFFNDIAGLTAVAPFVDGCHDTFELDEVNNDTVSGVSADKVRRVVIRVAGVPTPVLPDVGSGGGARVSEPAALSLFAGGIIAFGVYRRRRANA